MKAEQIKKEAEEIKEAVIADRRYLHAHAETGFDLKETVVYVKKELQNMGY